MKKSSPISLFSFQDIITSLTGIMIVVVLVILLQLVESSRIAAAYAKMQPEYQMLKKVYEELLVKRENLKKKIVANAESADKYAKSSVEEILKQISDEEIYAKELEKQIARLESELSSLSLKNTQKKIRCDQLKSELQKLSKQRNEIRELQAQLLALQQRQKNIDQMIAHKKKTLRFEFSGYDNQTPLLIECNAWGFRCQQYPDGNVITMGTPGAGSLPKQLSKLRKWITGYDTERCYPVLLFRKPSLLYFDKIAEELFGIFQKRCWAQELVGNEEEIFQ